MKIIRVNARLEFFAAWMLMLFISSIVPTSADSVGAPTTSGS